MKHQDAAGRRRSLTMLARWRQRGADRRRGSGPGRLRSRPSRASASCWCRWRWASTSRRAGPPISKTEVEGWGGVFETRDPNWSVEAGAQAITDADLFRPQAGRADHPLAGPQLLFQADEEGAGRRHLRHPDRQSRQFRGRRLRRQRLGPPRPARGRSGDQGLRRELDRRRSAWSRATRSTPPASTNMPAS